MSSSSAVPQIQLNNGAAIPIVGQGVYMRDKDESKAKRWLATAIKAGFRHFDTAQMYNSEHILGEAIRECNVPRDQLFVVSKLNWYDQDDVSEAFGRSLATLGLGYIDLFLLHWPQALPHKINGVLQKNPDGSIKVREDITFNQAWADMEKLLDTGKVKAIGVSNFSEKTLEELLMTAKVVPAVNQVELHPYLAQEDLRKYCTKKGIIITAYTPSGYDAVRNDPVIKDLALKYNITPNQVILAWHLARDIVIISGSAKEEHQKENINLPTLDPRDVEKINNLDRNKRICNDFDEHGQVYGWTKERLGW